MNNADVFAFGRSEVGCFVQGIEGTGPLINGLSREAGAALGRVVRYGSESGGGLFPLDAHTISEINS